VFCVEWEFHATWIQFGSLGAGLKAQGASAFPDIIFAYTSALMNNILSENAPSCVPSASFRLGSSPTWKRKKGYWPA